MIKENIILASSSPRRIEIMQKNGIEPTVMPADVDETIPKDTSPQAAVMFLALKKALFVEGNFLNPNHENLRIEQEQPVIIAADTVVVYKDKIIGKPKNRQDAYEILSDLRGNTHYVITGVAILRAGTDLRRCFYETTKVFFDEYTNDQLSAYLDTDEPYDKAGAYAIQGEFGKYVNHIEGDLNNVIGFPWSRIQQELDRLL